MRFDAIMALGYNRVAKIPAVSETAGETLITEHRNIIIDRTVFALTALIPQTIGNRRIEQAVGERRREAR